MRGWFDRNRPYRERRRTTEEGEGTSSGQQGEVLGKRRQTTAKRGNSMHWCNVADGIPCDMDVGGCELTGACDNQVVSEHVEV